MRNKLSGFCLGALLAFLALSEPCPGHPHMLIEDTPDGRWLSAYAWYQSGENLSFEQALPFALAAYKEADTEFRELAERYDYYEPDLVAFRLEQLEAKIQQLLTTLNQQELEKAEVYADFIESWRQGEDRRYTDRFEEAIERFDYALSLLQELKEQENEAFAEVLVTQEAQIRESVRWMQEQVDLVEKEKALAPLKMAAKLEGTTDFIKEEDLPAASNAPASGALFPSGLLPASLPDAIELDSAQEPAGSQP